MFLFRESNNYIEMTKFYIFVTLAGIFISQASCWSPLSLYCYRCVSTHPGCGTPFNWLWYWGEVCPEDDDKCVKIIERKGAETIITRECLSSLRSVRTDIPADHYEGCRPAAKDVRLAHYVNNSIKELDIKRDYYDETTWCFCYFDNRCNGSPSNVVPFALLGIVLCTLRLL